MSQKSDDLNYIRAKPEITQGSTNFVKTVDISTDIYFLLILVESLFHLNIGVS